MTPDRRCLFKSWGFKIIFLTYILLKKRNHVLLSSNETKWYNTISNIASFAIGGTNERTNTVWDIYSFYYFYIIDCLQLRKVLWGSL